MLIEKRVTIAAAIALVSIASLMPAEAIGQDRAWATMAQRMNKYRTALARRGASAARSRMNLSGVSHVARVVVGDAISQSAAFFAQALVDEEARGAWVQRLAKEAFDASGGRLNVMVVNKSQDYEWTEGPLGVAYKDTFEYSALGIDRYLVIAFRSGVFRLRGDDNPKNWYSYGGVRRPGTKSVRFR